MALIIGLVPVNVFAQGVGIYPSLDSQFSEFLDQSTDTGNVLSEIISEDISKRELNVKHFRFVNGSYIAAVYEEPVHFQVGDKWEEIDNTLEQQSLVGDLFRDNLKSLEANAIDTNITESITGDAPKISIEKDQSAINNINKKSLYYKNKHNDFEVRLPSNFSGTTPVVVARGDYSLRFAMSNVKVSSAIVEQQDDMNTLPVSQEVSAKNAEIQLKNLEKMSVRIKRSGVKYNLNFGNCSE